MIQTKLFDRKNLSQESAKHMQMKYNFYDKYLLSFIRYLEYISKQGFQVIYQLVLKYICYFKYC